MTKSRRINSVSVLEIISNSNSLFNKSLKVSGWVRSLRISKNKTFLVLNDGSCFDNLQIIFSEEKLRKVLNEKSTGFGSFVAVKGFLKETPERKDSFEVEGEELIHFSSATNYPLQKKDIQLPFLREKSHLRSKTKFFLAVLKIRSQLSKAINEFFWKRNFFYVNTPIITTNDAEGGGESFKIRSIETENFFGKSANLSVSGQLHEEALVQGMGKVYNFSPCFRAENSNTTKHLSEFWMIEAEIASCDVNELMKTIESLLKYSIKIVLKECKNEISYLEEYQSKEIIKDLIFLYEKKFPRVKYEKCLEIIKLKKEQEEEFFEFDNIEWGIDFKSEHEKYLCDYFKSPLFITDYPIETKAFYAKIKEDQKTVNAVDLIFPQVGEIVGGSVREEDIRKMEDRVKSKKVREDLDWYFKIRDYGYSGSAGFGMGLERLMMVITKCENVRDVVPFYRSSKELNF